MCSAVHGLFLSVRNLELQLTVPARLIPSNHSVAWAAFSTGKPSEVTFGRKKQLRGKSVLNLKARRGSAFCDPRLEAQHKQCRRLESIVTGNIYKSPGMLWSGISRSQIDDWANVVLVWTRGEFRHTLKLSNNPSWRFEPKNSIAQSGPCGRGPCTMGLKPWTGPGAFASLFQHT